MYFGIIYLVNYTSKIKPSIINKIDLYIVPELFAVFLDVHVLHDFLHILLSTVMFSGNKKAIFGNV